MTDLRIIEGGKPSPDEVSRVFMAALIMAAGITKLGEKHPQLAKEAEAASQALQDFAAKLIAVVK